jgi:ADP-ribose pyrophosphatase
MKRRIYSGRIIALEVERVRLPNDVEIDLELVYHPGAAAVVAGDAADVILIRQYRHASGGYIWEIPAGTLNAGEAPEACARRELCEEAGVEADDVISLGYLLTTPGFCDERIHLFLARGLRDMGTQHEHDEVITEIRRVPWTEVFRMIESGEIVDGKTLVGLFRAAQWLGLPVRQEGR